jgi:chorismate mutase
VADGDGIDRWRERIDAVDRKIVELLNERSRCALEIGSHKSRLGLPIYDPAREQDIVRQAVAGNTGPLEDAAIRRLFERILDESRRLERTAAGPAPEPQRKDG